MARWGRSFFQRASPVRFGQGQNLKVDGGGYRLRDGQLPVHLPALTEDVICRRAPE
jgi:hypothetical protein